MKYNKKFNRKDAFIALLIALLPLLFYIYLLFPEEKTYDFLIFTFNSYYYEDVETMVWITMIKAIFVITYSIWFVTCKHWWRYAILIPLVFSVNQLIVIVNSELYYVDDYELLLSLLISIPIIGILLFISKKLNYYNNAIILASDVDSEMQSLWSDISNFNIKEYERIAHELKNLRMNRSNYDKKSYLKKLQSLHDNLISNLK